MTFQEFEKMTFDRKEYNKKYREKNKEAKTQYNKEYYEKNKEAITEYNKEYREKNKEAIYEQNKEYREKNKEAIYEQKKEYKEKNKEAITQQNKEYYEKNKEALNQKLKNKRKEDTKNLKLIIGNKSRVEDLVCYYCGFNYEVWKKRNTNRPYITYLTFDHIHSFFVVSQTFDKEAMNNHPIYKFRFINDRKQNLLLKKFGLSEEYLREYISLSCEQCQRDNFYQDKLDIKNYQDGLDLEENRD